MNNPDWPKILLDLRRDYMAISPLGKLVNSDWQHLNRLIRQEVNEPKYSVGVKLLKLHEEYCNELTEQDHYEAIEGLDGEDQLEYLLGLQ